MKKFQVLCVLDLDVELAGLGIKYCNIEKAIRGKIRNELFKDCQDIKIMDMTLKVKAG